MGLMDLPKRIWAFEYFRLCFIAAGIMVGFLVFGIMQEKITRKSCFGGVVDKKGKCQGGEKFEYEMVLVLCLTFWYSILARVLLAVPQLNSGERDLTHYGWYAAAAFTYLTAMVCGNMALRFISYPTQVIAKSSKPIPVMILGVLLAHKRYTIQKYFFVLLIVVGVVLFIYDGDNAVSKKNDEIDNSHLGLMLVGMSLLADGVLGAIEDRMRAKTKPSALNFMFKINMFTAVFLVVGTMATGEMFRFFEFAGKYPDLYYKIALAALSGSMGQIFIFMMISEFGPLPCSITTTLRKFFTVIISVIFMGNPLKTQQQIATVIVFAALFADAIWGKKQLCGKPAALPVPTEEPDVEKNEQKDALAEVELKNLKEKDNQLSH